METPLKGALESHLGARTCSRSTSASHGSGYPAPDEAEGGGGAAS